MSNETANMDFKYVLQDFNNVYIGARLTFAELCEQDDTPQRLRTAVFQYVIPEVGEEIRICDALSSMTKDSKLAMVLKQLRCKIKTVKPKIKVDKKEEAGQNMRQKSFLLRIFGRNRSRDSFVQIIFPSFISGNCI